MDLLILNAVQNLSTLECVQEHGRDQQKRCGFACRNAALFAGRLGWKSRRGLPVDSISGERNEFLVHSCISNYESRLLLGHCFGVKPTPGGTAGSAFSGLLPQAGMRLGPHSRKSTLGAWESDPLARLCQV